MPIVSIDWEKIKALYAGDTYLVALTDQHIALLSALSEQLTWEKTFRTEGYDWADKDTLDLEIADLQANLTMPVALTDIIQYIDEIEELLRLLQEQPGCCEQYDYTDGDQYGTPITEDSTNGVPQELVDSGWATDTNDWNGFYDYQCHVAHVLVNNMQSKVVSMEDFFDLAGAVIIGVGAILGLLGIVFSSGTSLLAGGILAATGTGQKIYDRLRDSGESAVPTPEEIQLSREALVCAWIDSAHDGVDDRIDGFYAAIDSEFNLIEAEILKLLMHRSILKALYSGVYKENETGPTIAQKMDDAGIGPGTYTCDCALPSGYNWVPANVISATPQPNTYGRVNTVDYGLGFLEIGDTSANSASWGCQNWPCGAATHNMRNDDYQTLAVRYTWTIDNSDGPPAIFGGCLAGTGVGYRYIRFYTYDAAEGIDAAWAATQADAWSVIAGGHAKRAVSYEWANGSFSLSDTTPGQSGLQLRCDMEFLVWVP